MNKGISEKDYAPILLFVYNRVDHVTKVVNALKTCSESVASDLFIFSDGPKNEAAVESVASVRNYIRQITGFESVTVIERSENWGIERSEIDGITTVIKKYGKAIVLEDDIQVGPSFLTYMNCCLAKYADEKQVYSVTGYSFLSESDSAGLPAYGFLPLASAWGWGTWADRWEKFKSTMDGEELILLCDRKMRKKFNMGFPYSDMLYNQYNRGKLTWDVLWYWTIFTNQGLTLFPKKTMVNNIGMDGTGVHYTDPTQKNRIEILTSEFDADELPKEVKEHDIFLLKNEEALKHLSNYPRSIIKKCVRELKDIVRWTIRHYYIARK